MLEEPPAKVESKVESAWHRVFGRWVEGLSCGFWVLSYGVWVARPSMTGLFVEVSGLMVQDVPQTLKPEA